MGHVTVTPPRPRRRWWLDRAVRSPRRSSGYLLVVKPLLPTISYLRSCGRDAQMVDQYLRPDCQGGLAMTSDRRAPRMLQA